MHSITLQYLLVIFIGNFSGLMVFIGVDVDQEGLMLDFGGQLLVFMADVCV